MRDLLRSEVLRSVSGLAMLGIASFVILIPALMVNVGPPLEGLRAIDDALATRTVFGLIASSAIVAMYLGSYSVSREYYYGSMARSLVMASTRRVFISKTLASVIASLALCVVGIAIWSIVTVVLLRSFGREPLFDGPFWRIVWGSLFASACGGAIGVAVGWLVRNYYAASGIVLLLPLMIEAPLLFNLPEVERYLPVGAIAGLAALPLDGLLPWWASGLVLLGWSVAATAAAALVVRRREH